MSRIPFSEIPTKLSGMKYANFYYTAEEWVKKTGEDPRCYPKYFEANRFGQYGITDYGRKIFKVYYNQISENWQALGVNNR